MQLDELFPDVRSQIVGSIVALAIAALGYFAHGIVPRYYHAAITILDRWRIGKERKHADRALRDPNFYAFLQWYHLEQMPLNVGTTRVTLYQHANIVYPAVVIPVPNPDETGYNCVLGPWHAWDTFLNGGFVAANLDYVKRRKRRGVVKNRQTYCLERMEVTEGSAPSIQGGLVGYYEDCLATCDALEDELLSAFGRHQPVPPGFADFAAARLLQREKLTRFYKEHGRHPATSGAGRSAAIAVATLLVCRTPSGSFVTFFGPRSGKTAVHTHLLHVAPSGMFQPSRDWPSHDDPRHQTEWDIRHHIYRELPEELFGIDPEETPGSRPRRFYGIPDVHHLRQTLEADPPGARIYVTGVMVNLLNLRPEICTLLIIDEPRWYERHDCPEPESDLSLFKPNWEFSSDEELREQQRKSAAGGRCFWHFNLTPDGRPITDEEVLTEQRIDMSAANWVVPGAIAFWLGLDLWRKKFTELGH